MFYTDHQQNNLLYTKYKENNILTINRDIWSCLQSRCITLSETFTFTFGKQVFKIIQNSVYCEGTRATNKYVNMYNSITSTYIEE